MQKSSVSSVIWGLILIGLGVGFFLNSFNAMNFGDFISTYWPIILILIAIGELVQSKMTSAAIWGVIGFVFLLRNLDYFQFDVGSVIFPLILVIIGINVIFRSTVRSKMKADTSDHTSTTAAFAGNTKIIASKNFKSANLNAIFGGAKMDLSQAQISKDGAVIDVMIVFGGAEIIIPSDVPVIMNTSAIFGGSEDKRNNIKINESIKPVTIQGTVLFGGVEVKN